MEGDPGPIFIRCGRENLPSAIFAVNDPTAIGAMEVLDEHQIKVPEEVSIIGYDNLEIAKFLKNTINHH